MILVVCGGMRYFERDSLTLYCVFRELPTNIVDSNHQQQEVTNHWLNSTRRWDGGQCHGTSPWEHPENWRILEVSEVHGRVHVNQAAESAVFWEQNPRLRM